MTLYKHIIKNWRDNYLKDYLSEISSDTTKEIPVKEEVITKKRKALVLDVCDDDFPVKTEEVEFEDTFFLSSIDSTTPSKKPKKEPEAPGAPKKDQTERPSFNSTKTRKKMEKLSKLIESYSEKTTKMFEKMQECMKEMESQCAM